MLFFASGASKGFYFTPSFDDSLAAHISQLATLSAAAGKAACQSADESAISSWRGNAPMYSAQAW
jgi:hypothetical protein